MRQTMLQNILNSIAVDTLHSYLGLKKEWGNCSAVSLIPAPLVCGVEFNPAANKVMRL